MSEVAYLSASRVFPGNPPVRAVDQLELDVPEGLESITAVATMDR